MFNSVALPGLEHSVWATLHFGPCFGPATQKILINTRGRNLTVCVGSYLSHPLATDLGDTFKLGSRLFSGNVELSDIVSLSPKKRNYWKAKMMVLMMTKSIPLI